MKSAKDKRSKKKSDKEGYNTGVIFSRVLLILGTNQIDFENIFDFELAAVPSSLFKESGEPRYPQSKSVLMTKLKAEENARGVKPDSVVIDGGEMLHIIHWSTGGTVRDLRDKSTTYKGFLHSQMSTSYLIVTERVASNRIQGTHELELFEGHISSPWKESYCQKTCVCHPLQQKKV